MLEEGAQHTPVEFGTARRLKERTRRSAADLRVADLIEPRSGGEQGACPAQAREETAATHRFHRRYFLPRNSLIRPMNSSTFERFTTTVGTMICFDSGMNDRSPRTACAIRTIAW